ncbi:hypothetical protein BZL29_0300 [Mycobacterium kansasii]|uniref:Uncharacterized protein n=1 Tax=Mycobacterium kansasii TaxID=1768 RepID=A0A1V3XXY7_MYCKA|nr:hypothetical protein BZL29_0300 [Mycobacterium kansasii]
MAASDNRPPSRLVRITVGASNSKSVKRIPRADRVDGGAARPTGRQIRFGCFVVCLVPQQLPTAHRRARDRGYLARRTPRAAVLVEYPRLRRSARRVTTFAAGSRDGPVGVCRWAPS